MLNALRGFWTYMTGPAVGGALTVESGLLAVLWSFVAYLVAAILFKLFARHQRGRNEVAHHQLDRLGNALLYASIPALLLAWAFYEGAYNKRFVLFLMLLVLWAIMFYAIYFLLDRYPVLARAQRDAQEQERLRADRPTRSSSLADAVPATTPGALSSGTRRRRRASRTRTRT